MNIAQSEEKAASLINCESCSKSIAKTSNICPNCGAPNTWVHPKILEFKNKGAYAEREFVYWNNRVELWGETSPTNTGWTISVISLGAILLVTLILTAIFGMPTGSFLASVIFVAPVGFIIHTAVKKPRFAFQANLQDKTWASDNDDFWRHVREALEL